MPPRRGTGVPMVGGAGCSAVRKRGESKLALSMAQASPSHNDQEARPPSTQVELGYRLCLLIEENRTIMLRCGNACF
jgi:hypothetical protein